jgi:hypothetical protein
MGATRFRIGIIHMLEAIIPFPKYFGVGLRDADGGIRNSTSCPYSLPRR